jgi:hypothetical protein
MKAESYRRKLRKKIDYTRNLPSYNHSMYLQGRRRGLERALEWFKDVPL